MHVTFQIQGTGEEFEARVEAKLLALAAELGAVATAPETGNDSAASADWTSEQAEEVLRKLNGRATDLLRAVADGDGWVDGAHYRATHGETALHGPTAALTKAIKRAIKAGILPEGTANPLTSTYDGHSSWQKTGGYRMDKPTAAAFRAAFTRIDGHRTGAAAGPASAKTTALGELAAVFVEQGHPEHRAVRFATDLLNRHAIELAELQRAAGHHEAAALLDDATV
ncbi:hypothetical protein [Streptomyces sp. NBC_00454]|uniref:hypothetical protein n=1 Tax=Streptomyces sp. NBC_00454 TaxID=2975747 RepID=UPI002F90E184